VDRVKSAFGVALTVSLGAGAVVMHSQSPAIREWRYYGADHLEYGKAANNLGVVLSEAGLFREAQDVHRKAAAARTFTGEASKESTRPISHSSPTS